MLPSSHLSPGHINHEADDECGEKQLKQPRPYLAATHKFSTWEQKCLKVESLYKLFHTRQIYLPGKFTSTNIILLGYNFLTFSFIKEVGIRSNKWQWPTNLLTFLVIYTPSQLDDIIIRSHAQAKTALLFFYLALITGWTMVFQSNTSGRQGAGRHHN